MKLAILLHAYQPPTQFPDITSEIASLSYLPLVEIFEKSVHGRITFNMSGSLIEQLYMNGEDKLLKRYKDLVVKGTIEYVGTAAYHPILTKLPETEIIRQDKVNKYWLKKWLGKEYERPTGFFIPEMVYNSSVGKVINRLGYKWIILDESAYPGVEVMKMKDDHGNYHIGSFQYRVQDTNMRVFFRDNPLSLSVAFDKNLTADSFIEQIKNHENKFGEKYVIVAIDAETFGYHHKENLALLSDLLEQDEIELVTLSELYDSDMIIKDIVPVRSTWGVTVEGPNHKRTFPRWNNPHNEVHRMQWKLFNLALKRGKHTSDLPDNLDKAFHSDQFWWASKSPCWHPGMIERSLNIYETFLGNRAVEIIALKEALKNEDRSIISC